MSKIAVFPIPQCVTFPGTRYPLHVFEPRYRNMVEHCIRDQMPLAVCHVKKLVHEAPKEQTLDEVLNSNQATYKPVSVVSAGPCQILQTLPDGRMMINVSLQHRYHLDEEIQALPYLIYHAHRYEDELLDSDAQIQSAELKDKLLHRLRALTAENAQAQRLLNSDDWQQKPVQEFSFELFNLLQTDSDVMQSILEMRSPIQRMNTALSLLSDVPALI